MYDSHSFGLGEKPVELNKNKLTEVVTKISDNAITARSIEANLWLPFAAEAYDLSKDIKDYVLVPAPVILNDIPNTNGDSVSLNEFLRFDPEMGMQAFKTFRGKAAHLEHKDNTKNKKAKGVILDVFLRPIKNFGKGKYYKLVQLLAYDRSKDPLLVNSIMTGEANAYSVGFNYTSYSCSVCGHEVNNRNQTSCSHTKPGVRTYKDKNGKLVYRMCKHIRGFETSNVMNPAYVIAISDVVMDPNKL